MTSAKTIVGSTVPNMFRSTTVRKASISRSKIVLSEGGEALFLVSNVLDKALLEQNKQEILKAYGKIDVLVNLAGGNQAGDDSYRQDDL